MTRTRATFQYCNPMFQLENKLHSSMFSFRSTLLSAVSPPVEGVVSINDVRALWADKEADSLIE